MFEGQLLVSDCRVLIFEDEKLFELVDDDEQVVAVQTLARAIQERLDIVGVGGRPVSNQARSKNLIPYPGRKVFVTAELDAT